MAKNNDPFGFASAIQTDHLSDDQIDLVLEILKGIK